MFTVKKQYTFFKILINTNYKLKLQVGETISTINNNFVNKANLVNNLFLARSFLVYSSIPTRFGRLRAHH